FKELLETEYTVVASNENQALIDKADYISTVSINYKTDEHGQTHSNCTYILRDSIGRFPAHPNGLGFEYNSVTGAVTRNFD
ncbi:MAG: prepilin-type cleavage/methylation domain-containing protein, partial [Aeromonas veronii]